MTYSDTRHLSLNSQSTIFDLIKSHEDDRITEWPFLIDLHNK